MARMKVGAQLYTLRDYLKTEDEVKDTLSKVAEIGYKTIQLSGIGPVPRKAVAKVAKQAGLKIISTHIAWERFLENIDDVIEEHKLYKCKHPAIGGLPDEYFSIEGLKRFASEITGVAKRLADAGMDFSYHNHAHELVKYDGKTWLERLYEETGFDVVKCEIDTHWIAAGGGDPAEWISRYPGRQPILHLKDFVMAKGEQGVERRFAEIGEGNLNWPAILKAAKKSKVEYIVVEQDLSYERTPFESLAISYRNLKSWGYE